MIASFGVGWYLRGPGGAEWFCAECRPSREDVLDLAGIGVGADESGTSAGLAGFSSDEVDAGEAGLDWWRQPVEGWREGQLSITNMVTGEETFIDLRGRA